MSQLKEYIIALTNLYGAVHKEKVMEIYNSQNKDKVNLGLIEAMLKNPPVDLEAFAVYTEGAYFIHEAIFMIDNLEEMLKKKKGKPYYVPNNEELLHYMDEEYFEKTREYKALLGYVKKNFLKNQPEKAEELCEEIHKILHIGPDMQEVMNTLNYRGTLFVNEVVRFHADCLSTSRRVSALGLRYTTRLSRQKRGPVFGNRSGCISQAARSVSFRRRKSSELAPLRRCCGVT